MITERDIQVIRYLGRWGWGTVKLLLRKGFFTQRSVAYRRLRLLRAEDLVEHTRPFRHRSGAYWVTRAGMQLAGEGLTPAEGPSLTYWEHDLAVAYIAVGLLEMHPDTTWLTERELNRAYAEQGDRRGRRPDGALVFPDGSRWAVEYENSRKKKRRLTAIIKNKKKREGGYGRDGQNPYERVLWIPATPGIHRLIKRCVPESDTFVSYRKHRVYNPVSFDVREEKLRRGKASA